MSSIDPKRTPLVKTCWFLVVKARGEWWVDCEGKSYGPFESADLATSNAIRFGEVFGDAGRQSQVWAPDDTGRMQHIWSGDAPERAS